MRRLLVAIGVLVVLLAASAAAVLWFLRGDGVRLALEQQASAWLGQPVRIGTARAQLLPRLGIHLGDVRIGQAGEVNLASVDVATGLRPLLSRRIEDAELLVSDSRLTMPLPFQLSSGGRSTASATTDFQVVSISRIRLDNVRIVSRGRELDVSIDSSVTGPRVQLTEITAAASNTSVRGSGSITLQPAPDMQLELDADRIDVDDLLALAQAFTPGGQDGARAANQVPGRLTARVTATEVTAAGLRLPQFVTTVRVQGGRISLSPTRFLLFGGRYEGDLDVSLVRDTSMTLAARVRDVDVAQLAAFGGVPDTITGRLTGSGTFSGSGPDLRAVLASASGEGTATISTGTIRNLNLVRTVVLFFGRPAPDTASATDAFERIDVRFTLANQVLNAEALSMRSRDSDVVGSATLALNTQQLSGRADLSLSEELSAQAGTDLSRYTREGNRIVLPTTIRGTLGSPQLSIDAGAAIERGLRNEVERRLKGLLEQFGTSR